MKHARRAYLNYDITIAFLNMLSLFTRASDTSDYQTCYGPLLKCRDRHVSWTAYIYNYNNIRSHICLRIKYPAFLDLFLKVPDSSEMISEVDLSF